MFRWNALRVGIGLAALLACGSARAQTDGIFADFTTSLGNFTCALDYTNAPRTVANFIGLATGQRAWLDLVSGRVRTNAFYDGLTFHRVIAGFMNQGGSPNGQGSDGPGYAFKDEFTPSLTFSNSWILAMANSGPDSNGSQFFVTVGPQTHLNNKHSIFGRVTSGTNVVNTINHVATSPSNDKPLTNVVIQTVTIRRVGTAAQAFNINSQSLPAVVNPGARFSLTSSNVTLQFTNRLYADNRFYSTTNLNSWTGELLGIETDSSFSNAVTRSRTAPQGFYSLAQVQYPSSTYAPKTLTNRTLALTLTNGGSGTITIKFNGAAGGTYTYGLNNGTVDGYYWTQEPYRGRLVIGLSGYPVLNLLCNFKLATNGFFSGSALPNYPSSLGSFPVGGTFTNSP
jgi:peptidyl-prolyl cis-trans isomerase A (cyclophilin A)